MEYLKGEKEIEAIRWMHEATGVAGMSLCHRKKCGTIIVLGGKVIGRGYNAPPLDREEYRVCHKEFGIGKPKYDRVRHRRAGARVTRNPMAYYNKIGLLILDAAGERFLVCEKDPKNVTSDFIMPGGQLKEANDVECLKAEIREELDCDVDVGSLELLGEYTDVAAGRPDREVMIRLYRGRIIGTPKPSTEIVDIHWIGAIDATNHRVSPIIRNRIIPDLVHRGILSA